MKEREHIQKLLDSYMAAETTQEEELFLADYFCTHRDIPSEWREYSILFRGMRQKPGASYMRAMLKWSVAAAIVAFVFGAGVLLTKQGEAGKPTDAIAQTLEVPTPAVTEQKQETSAEEPTVVAEMAPKPSRSARMAHSTQQEAKEVEQMLRLLDEADRAFTQATAQCAIDINETIPQSEEQEETDRETNIII